jgi:hypothetical protein
VGGALVIAAKGSKVVCRVVNDRGLAFNVVLARRGDAYGRNGCLVHDANDPLVEFYDATYENDACFDQGCGQFVARYYLSTLSDHRASVGLDLCGHVPAWKISGQNIAAVLVAVDAVRPTLDNLSTHAAASEEMP